jgi:hypothetical protein
MAYLPIVCAISLAGWIAEMTLPDVEPDHPADRQAAEPLYRLALPRSSSSLSLT